MEYPRILCMRGCFYVQTVCAVRMDSDQLWGGDSGWDAAGIGVFCQSGGNWCHFRWIERDAEKIVVINLSSAEYALIAKDDKE